MPAFLPVTLTTARLRLRHVQERDRDAYYAIFSDPLVMRYYSGSAWTELSQASEAIARAIADYASGDGLRFAIERIDGDGAGAAAMVGTISLHHFFAQNRRCEVGYAMASAHWGQGFLGEAMQAVVDHAFGALDMNRIEADIDPRNAASSKVLLRVGFEKEGFMPERWIVNGEVCDTDFYGLLRRTWEAR